MTEVNSGDNAKPRPAITNASDAPAAPPSRPPLPVALVTTELGVGGAERCLVEIALGLSRERFVPHVYSLAAPPSPPRDALVGRLKQANVTVRFLGVRRAWQFPSAVRQMADWLRQDNVQLIQSFLFHANVVAAQARRRARVPRLLAGWRVADPRRWRLTVERWAERHADFVVCVSDEVADQARRAGVSDDRIVVIPNGVDVARIALVEPADLATIGLPSDRRPLVCVGRLDPQKGFDHLLTLAPRLLAELPAHDLVFIGDGPQRQELERLATHHGVAARVHFAGWRADVPSCLRAADVVLIPSRWEGMPNVLLEAMAAGRAVVANRVEGVTAVLGEHLAETQSVPLGDDEAFIGRVVSLATDGGLRDGLGLENRRRANDEHSLEKMIERYERLFSSVSGRK